MAPELAIKGTMNFTNDIFAFGIVCAMTLLGERLCEARVCETRTVLLPPTPRDIARALEGAYDISPCTRRMVWTCIREKPHERLTMDEIVDHNFFKEMLGPTWRVLPRYVVEADPRKRGFN